MERVLEPELLDTLSPNDPAALHNRRDLRLTNQVMRNHAWLRRTLAAEVRPGERVLEIGAGDGLLGVALNRAGRHVDALDLWPRPQAWPPERCWHREDIRTFSRWADYDVVFGNLIFHQFSDAELRATGVHLQRARLIVACEPARRRLSQYVYAAIAPLLGANHVTLHDAHVSIAAGFRGHELPAALGLVGDRWVVSTGTTHLGAYRMVATRRS